MLKVTVICVGSLSEKHWREACDEYKKRLGAAVSISEIQLKEEKLPRDPSEAQINKALDAEADMIISKIPKKAFLVPMCIEGKQFSSEELAGKIESAEIGGKSDICFIIGSSFGLSDKVKERADLKLSMSKLTFPHQLARVMLYETVYRCFSIINGGKYHK